MSELSDSIASQAIAHITRLSAVETVRARIALAIKYGLLQPGERLPSDEAIAEALDVSVMTARRALVRLAEDGVVLRRRGKSGGTFVEASPRLDSVEAIGSYEADEIALDRLIDQRALVESALVASASLRTEEKALQRLQDCIDRAHAATDWAEFHQADEDFHLTLVDASGLGWARGLHSEVLSQLYQYFLPYPIEYLRESNAEHQRILDAVRSGDTTTAIAECQAHIRVLHETMFTGLHRKQLREKS